MWKEIFKLDFSNTKDWKESKSQQVKFLYLTTSVEWAPWWCWQKPMTGRQIYLIFLFDWYSKRKSCISKYWAASLLSNVDNIESLAKYFQQKNWRQKYFKEVEIQNHPPFQRYHEEKNDLHPNLNSEQWTQTNTKEWFYNKKQKLLPLIYIQGFLFKEEYGQ